MDGIGLVRAEIEKARKQVTGSADRQGAVTRTEAIAIVRRAVVARVTADEIRAAFRDAGDNGFGRPMERYLNEFDIVRLIGSDPGPTVRLPHKPTLQVRAQEFSSTYGKLTLMPQAGPQDAKHVTLEATCSNKHPYSSGPGETPLVYGRDGLFDQVALRCYGYTFSDPLSDEDRARAAALAGDREVGRARERFIEAGPGRIDIELPRQPQVPHD
ncbi:MAG TPA: hypothetical protein VNM90_10070 [Haliangium sp.]|nr:hypothetical protein [Haliangium sp.]